MAGITDLQNLQVQRVVSGLAAGVKMPQNYIAERALPLVNTNSENFAYSTWGNEGMRNVETRRGLDADYNEIKLATGTATGELEEHTIGASYDLRRLKAADEAGNGDQFRLNHAAALKNLVAIQKEIQVANIVFGASNYGSNTASNVDVNTTGFRRIFLAAKDAREQQCGVRMDKVVAGVITHRELLMNPDIIDLIKYTRGGSTNASLIAEYLEVDEYIVGNATYQASAAAGAAGTATSIWTEDSMALISTASDSTASPCFAKLFYMNSPASGSQSLVRTWVPEPGLVEKMIYSEFFKPATVFTAAGYLWTNTDQ